MTIIITNKTEITTKPVANSNLFFFSATKNIGRFINAANEINPPNLF